MILTILLIMLHVIRDTKVENQQTMLFLYIHSVQRFDDTIDRIDGSFVGYGLISLIYRLSINVVAGSTTISSIYYIIVWGYVDTIPNLLVFLHVPIYCIHEPIYFLWINTISRVYLYYIEVYGIILHLHNTNLSSVFYLEFWLDSRNALLQTSFILRYPYIGYHRQQRIIIFQLKYFPCISSVFN